MKNIFADYYVNAKNIKGSITLYFFKIGLGKFDVGSYEMIKYISSSSMDCT